MPRKSIHRIIADDREKNDRLLIALQEAGNTDVRIGRLVSGDYLLDNLLVERKTFSDLCVSISNGRLFRQATELASAKIQPIFILEGSSDDLKATGMKREAIQGALITLALIFKIPVLRSLSPEETARLIIYAANQIKDSQSTSKIYPRTFPGRNNYNRKQKVQMHVLQGFPGIGPVLAKRLLNKFGTLSDIFNAAPGAINNIEGIGKNLAKQFYEILK